jgi:hypothetical protein
MRNTNTAFYSGKTEVLVDFSAEAISSDDSLLLLGSLSQSTSCAPLYQLADDMHLKFAPGMPGKYTLIFM